MLKASRTSIFTSEPHPRRAPIGSASDPSEDGDLTLLRSIDSKKADVEFACSRQPRNEDEDDEEEEEEEEVELPAVPEAAPKKETSGAPVNHLLNQPMHADSTKPAKKPDGSFMVDLLRQGNSSLSLNELFKFKKAFFAADDNGNGVLEWEEFREAFRLISDDIAESDIMTWFAKIDGDCDGFVEWDECFNFLVAKGEANYFGKPSGDERLRPCEDIDPVPSRHGHLGMMEQILVIEEHDKYASVARDGQLKIFYRESLMPCHSIHVGSVTVYDACNIVGSNRIATASSDKHVTFFDATTFGRQKDFLKYKESPTAVDFSKDFGSYHLAVGLENGTLFLYSEFRPSSVTHGKISGPQMELKRHGGRITCIKFVPDIQALVTSSMDGTLKTTHVATGREMRSFTPFDKGAGITHFDFLAEFKALVCCAGNPERGSSEVYIFHPEKLSPLAKLEGHEANVRFCMVDNVSNMLLTFANDKTIKIWDLVATCNSGEGKELGHYDISQKFYPEDKVSAACFDPGSSRILFGATCIVPWVLNRPYAPPKPHSDMIVCSLYSSVFQSVLTADLGATICCWNYYTGEMLLQFRAAPEGCQLLSMALSGDERRLITATDDGRVAIFNFTCGRLLDLVCEGRSNEAQTLIHIDIRDTLFFATVHPDRCLRIWPDTKFAPSAKQRDLYTLPDEVTYLTQCPDRHLIFVGCANGELIVWQASLAQLFVKFYANNQEGEREEGGKSVEQGSPSPADGEKAAIAVEFVCPLPPPADKSAQGALLVCCSDGYIRTWDLGSGAEQPELLTETFARHIGMLFSSHCVSADKTMLFTADIEGFMKVWDLRGDCNPSHLRRNSLAARPGLPTQVDHWRASRRAVNSIGYVEKSHKSETLLITSSGGMEATFWTLDGVKVGSIGEGMPVLWNSMDRSTWDQHQEKAEDLDPNDVKDEEDEYEQVVIVRQTEEDRRKAVQDMVGNIFDHKKFKKNNFKVDRTMNVLSVHKPEEIEYRDGTGPQVLQLEAQGKPRYKKKKSSS